jgi:Protein of unknown function (DUF4232)
MHTPVLSPRRLTGVAAIACAAALAPAAALAAAASPASTSNAGVPACQTSRLVVWMDTPGNGAAGTVFYTLMFTNLSGHACTLDGYPGVSAVSLSGRQVGSPAAWGPPGAHPVRLAKGATAYAVLQYSDVVTSNSGPRPCDPVMAAGLRVYPPDQTASKIVPIPLKACTSSVIYMSVRTVQLALPPGQRS